MRSAAILATFMLLASAARAQEQVPFPELDTPGFCAALVSKTLNPAEKKVEEAKCLVRKQTWKDATQPYWQRLAPKQQAYIITQHFKEVENQTYGTVLKYVASNVENACSEMGELVCKTRKR